MAGKAVPSSAGGGPHDFSAEVRANFAQAASPVPDGGVCLEARVRLGESEAAKLGAGDLFAAIAELLARHGVDMEHCFHEVFRTGDPAAAARAGRMPR